MIGLRLFAVIVGLLVGGIELDASIRMMSKRVFDRCDPVVIRGSVPKQLQHFRLNGYPVPRETPTRFSIPIRLEAGRHQLVFSGVLKGRQVEQTVPVICNAQFRDLTGRSGTDAIVKLSSLVRYGGDMGQPYFRPTELMRRREAAIFLTQWLGLDAANRRYAFHDLSSDLGVDHPIQRVVDSRLMTTAMPGYFDPDGYLSQEEWVDVLRRIDPEADRVFRRYDFGGDPHSLVTREQAFQMVFELPLIRRRVKRFYSLKQRVGDEDREFYPAGSVVRRIWTSPSLVTVGTPVKVAIFAELASSVRGDVRVTVDLGPVGKASNVTLRNDGTWGDESAKDRIYTTVFRLRSVGAGKLPIRVSVWRGKKRIGGESMMMQAKAVKQNTVTPVGMPGRYEAEQERYAVYVVKRGDTLPQISRRLLGDSQHWRRIAEVNHVPVREVKTDGKVRYLSQLTPGQVLFVADID